MGEPDRLREAAASRPGLSRPVLQAVEGLAGRGEAPRRGHPHLRRRGKRRGLHAGEEDSRGEGRREGRSETPDGTGAPPQGQGARPGVGRTALRMDPNNHSRVEGGRAARHDGTPDPVGADGRGRFDERHEPGLERVDPRGQGVLPVRQTVAGSGQGPGAWRVHAQRGGERPGAAPPPVDSLPSGRGASAAPAGPQGGRDRRGHVGP